MKGFARRMGMFIRNFNECISTAAKDCDTHYHIPKSRFSENRGEGKSRGPARGNAKFKARNVFLGSFRDCFVQAWRDSDEHYNIPKTRYADYAYNRTAYISPQARGILSKIAEFPSVLKGCISMAWKASDTLYYLPKNCYRDRDFVTRLMGKVPAPAGKLLIRPFTIGFGMAGYEGAVESWTVGLPTERGGDVFVMPEDTGHSTDTEVEM